MSVVGLILDLIFFKSVQFSKTQDSASNAFYNMSVILVFLFLAIIFLIAAKVRKKTMIMNIAVRKKNRKRQKRIYNSLIFSIRMCDNLKTSPTVKKSRFRRPFVGISQRAAAYLEAQAKMIQFPRLCKQ